MVLRGVWESTINKELLEVTYYVAFPKDLLIRNLTLQLILMKHDNANAVPAIQGKEILNRWHDLAYFYIGFSSCKYYLLCLFYLLFCRYDQFARCNVVIGDEGVFQF